MWTKALADSNSWSAAHKPDTLTTELWQYSTKSIDTVYQECWPINKEHDL